MAAYDRSILRDFVVDDPKFVLGQIASRVSHNELQRRQIKAWEREIEILQSCFRALLSRLASAETWSLLLEYPIPRRRKRLDAVLIAGDVIICVEFKTEDKAHSLASQRQAEDYALDLRDFHEVSRDRKLVPLVVVPKAPPAAIQDASLPCDSVRTVRLANKNDLVDVILEIFQAEHTGDNSPIDPEAWDRSPYRPVPTIIEAAEALFAGHNVREIAHSHAGSKNLTLTSDRLIKAVQDAQVETKKVICFVTGVPGAGKTLAGLNVVHNPALRTDGRPAGVFLSGNGPLVKIVSAAVTRDRRSRSRTGDEERTVGAFIQGVHEFVREALEKPDKPQVERVVVFDEAQRAWNADQNRKKNGTDVSEPETMLSIMDRHPGWAVLIALVGAGQEIHNGEAGLEEWGRALREKFPHWNVIVSPEALDAKNSANAGHRLFEDGLPGSLIVQTDSSLHLDVTQRSFRAQRVADWVDAALKGEFSSAAEIFPQLEGFPLIMTRSLDTARKWLREKTRGRQRCGLLASSGALRLRPEGLELSSGFRQGNRDMYVHWFLAEPPDVRSSNQLEVAASEFECQGLELDWVGICWAGDFTRDPGGQWEYRCFSGSKWGKIAQDKVIDRRYALNTYRVLMTRARQGLVIWVPAGDANDFTRPASWFDETAAFLRSCGVPTI